MSSVQPLPLTALLATYSGQDGFQPPATDLTSDAKSFMRRVLQDSTPYIPHTQAPARPKRNYETAFRLLEDAALALSSLQDRQEQLEASVAALQSEANFKIEAAEERVKEWQAFAVVLKGRLRDAEERLAAMQERAQAAEAQANLERARAAAAEHRESYEGALSKDFHDKIISVFGAGSRAHFALSAVAGRIPPSIEYE